MGEIKLGKLISEGKTKKVYEIDDPDKVALVFKDDITALDGEKHDIIRGKGYINATLSAKFFQVLESHGVPTHFIEYIEPNIIIARKVNMLPVEVVLRNIAAGHFVKNFPMVKAGTQLKIPVIEFYYKSDELHDPMLNDYHMQVLGLATAEEIEEIKRITLEVNKALREFLKEKKLELVDFKIEFGRDKENKLLVGDEINGDSMRLWKIDGGILDKDVYRKGGSLDEVLDTYIELFKTIMGYEPKL
ncbi:MAG: phosphoribosylaminoimidazolesuccinocarboxamide synthase [Candidatus Odinarchaeia archaeon]